MKKETVLKAMEEAITLHSKKSTLQQTEDYEYCTWFKLGATIVKVFDNGMINIEIHNTTVFTNVEDLKFIDICPIHNEGKPHHAVIFYGEKRMIAHIRVY